MSYSSPISKVIKSKSSKVDSSKKERKKKTVRIELVVDEDEAKIIDDNAQKMYLNRSEYARARMLKRVYTAARKLPEPDYLTLVTNLRELRAQGNNLNQIARGINQSLKRGDDLNLDITELQIAIQSNIRATQTIIAALT